MYSLYSNKNKIQILITVYYLQLYYGMYKKIRIHIKSYLIVS